MWTRYRFVTIILIAILASCTSNQTVNTPIISPMPEIMPTSSAAYDGVILESELATLDDNILEFAQIISDFDNLEILQEAPIFQNNDWAVFQCNQVWHSGSRIGSFTDYRVCGINQDGSRQEIIAQQIYTTSISPDNEWIALGGDTENHLTNCKNQVYVMRSDGTDFHPLIDDTEYENNLRICGITELQWQFEQGGYQITFSGWTGSAGDYPTYTILFDPVNITGRLIR